MTPRSKAKSKYANPTVQILVGEPPVPFHVHSAFLEKTAFFEVHPLSTLPESPGPPRMRPAASLSSPAPSDSTVLPEDVEVKMEDIEDEATLGSNDAASTISTTISEMTPRPMFHLKGALYEPAAFEVIVNYLYNIRPNAPQHRNDFITLRKTYVLALRYRMERLQDDLVDRFRDFHVSYNVNFEDLIWLANRISGDKAEVSKVPMVRYLTDQVAFEIYREGYDTFARGNLGFENFLTTGTRVLRRELFKAMAKLSQARNPPDPAMGPNRWRVQDYQAFEQGEMEREEIIDAIELDD